jgi:hypothetical protein
MRLLREWVHLEAYCWSQWDEMVADHLILFRRMSTSILSLTILLTCLSQCQFQFSQFPWPASAIKPIQRMEGAQTALSLTGDVISVFQEQSELWEEAYKNLKRTDSRAIQALDLKNLSLKDLNDCLDAATRAQKDSKDKEWKLIIRGREFKCYDVFTNIVGFIEAFQKVIDPAVAVDVSGKVALPWTGIKFLLGVESPAGRCLLWKEYWLTSFTDCYQRAR